MANSPQSEQKLNGGEWETWRSYARKDVDIMNKRWLKHCIISWNYKIELFSKCHYQIFLQKFSLDRSICDLPGDFFLKNVKSMKWLYLEFFEENRDLFWKDKKEQQIKGCLSPLLTQVGGSCLKAYWHLEIKYQPSLFIWKNKTLKKKPAKV